jgi:hypothetical protein
VVVAEFLEVNKNGEQSDTLREAILQILRSITDDFDQKLSVNDSIRNTKDNYKKSVTKRKSVTTLSPQLVEVFTLPNKVNVFLNVHVTKGEEVIKDGKNHLSYDVSISIVPFGDLDTDVQSQIDALAYGDIHLAVTNQSSNIFSEWRDLKIDLEKLGKIVKVPHGEF